MGVDAVNFEPSFHGQDVSGPAIDIVIRLHLEDTNDSSNDFDESHVIGNNAMKSVLQDVCDNDKPGFNSTVGTWLDANAGTIALGYKSELLNAAWRAFPH